MKITNKEALNLKYALEQKTQDFHQLRGANFAWALGRNLSKLEKVAKEVLKKRTILPEYVKYEQDRVTICEQFTEKDELGKPKLVKDEKGIEKYSLDETNPEFRAAIDKLRDKNAKLLGEQKVIFDNFKAALEEEVEIDFIMLDLRFVPSEITGELMSLIEFMVHEI